MLGSRFRRSTPHLFPSLFSLRFPSGPLLQTHPSPNRPAARSQSIPRLPTVEAVLHRLKEMQKELCWLQEEKEKSGRVRMLGGERREVFVRFLGVCFLARCDWFEVMFFLKR